MDIQILEQAGAVLNGHFQLSSGRHSALYFEKFRLLERPALLTPLVQAMVAPWRDKGIEVVVGPTIGGLLVAYEAARQLNLWAGYAEREGEQRVFRRGLCFEPDMRALVVDDVLTTGLSVQEMIAASQSAGLKVAGVTVLIDRSETPPDFGCDFTAALRLEGKTYAPDACPLCQQGIPLTKRGSRGI